MVRKKRKVEPPEPAADDTEFFKDMKELLDDEEHMDTLFLVHPIPPSGTTASPGGKRKMSSSSGVGGGEGQKKNDLDVNAIKREVDDSMDEDGNNGSSGSGNDNRDNLIEIRAHKCILTARADYFKALFRKMAGENSSGQRVGTFRESTECVIRVEPYFTPKIVRLMLEFMYTNRIECLKASSKLEVGLECPHRVTTDELLSLLHLADMWQLRDLKRLVEHELIRSHMNVNTVSRMYCATDDLHAKRLSKSCLEFIMQNYREVTGSVAFQEEMKHHPDLCIPVLKAAADLIPEPAHKKARTSTGSDMGKDTPGSGTGGGLASSPVPDSDH